MGIEAKDAVTSAELLELARAVAVEAGELIARRRSEGVEVAATKSNVTDVVTFADKESEARIRSLIQTARPADGFLGEEGARAEGTSGLTWIVDPIDGTVNYLYDIPAYAVSVAVVDGPPVPNRWRALAGVVVNPVLGEVFEASLGGGARLRSRSGERMLRVNTGVGLGLALVGTGFGYRPERREKQAAVVARLLPRIRDIRRMGSAALDLCALAAGRIDACYERGLQPWDHAAAALIAAEAGATVSVSDDSGAEDDPRLIVAAAPALHDELLPLLVEP